MSPRTANFIHNPALDTTPLSVFEPIIARLKSVQGKRIIPLHQGKTVYTTPVQLRPWGADEFDYPHYQDGPTCGTETLIEAIRKKLEAQLSAEIDADRIQVTCGITHGLSIALHCILRPGDEVLVLSPQWLFVNGLVRAAGGVPVEVPFFPMRGDEPFVRIEALLYPYLSSAVRAIYFNSPNNPTGRSLSLRHLEQLSAIAAARGIYLIADNAYEYYDYSLDGFVDPCTLPGGSDRVFSAFSFSKSFGLTGYRIGYLLSPPAMAKLARKFGLYSIYSVPTCCQFAALSALRASDEVIESHRAFIRKALDITVEKLRVPCTIPDGGFYTFLDLSSWREGVDDFINECVSDGVSLAPGRVFGERCGNYARLCYSVVGHNDLTTGIEVINNVFERSHGL